MGKNKTVPVLIVLISCCLAVIPLQNQGKSMPVEGEKTNHEFNYQYMDILGTSMDLTVVARTEAEANAVEQAVLGEIERLRLILSTYDSNSELVKVMASGKPVWVSPEIIDVLSSYDRWQQKSGGVYSGQIGELAAVWKNMEQKGSLPTQQMLAEAIAKMNTPAWEINKEAGTVRILKKNINVNSLGKGYIIGKAMEAARKSVPTVMGLMLNIGGDIRVWGSSSFDTNIAWKVGVADPAHSEENAAPLTIVALHDKAIATSAAYERYYTIGKQQYSHIFDPRTGQSAKGVLSSTVIADDSASANALATTLCVLSPEEGLRLVQSVSGAQCLIVAEDGRQLRSEGFAAIEQPVARPLAAAAAANAWPKDFKVKIDININGAKKKPYMCLWITDANQKHVRTIEVWGTEVKYLPEMKEWWKIGKKDPALVRAVTRATRQPGKYSFTWDGKDQKGNPLPKGNYLVWLEVYAEKSPYGLRSGWVQCMNAPYTGNIEGSKIFAESVLTYDGPKGN